MNEVSVDSATAAAVLSEPDSIFAINEEQRMALKGFFYGEDVAKRLWPEFCKHDTSGLVIGR